MAQIFPKWTNQLPVYFIAGAVVILTAVAGIFWFYGSPKYSDVGYRPKQPVPYSHKLHAGDLGLDCRYCHSQVETSAAAGIPPTQTCMNCHKLILPESEKLLPVRESWSKRLPIQWVRVHNLPDFVYFDHSVHLNAGVGCASCHGNVAQMDVVMQKEPLSMSWCLDCHRNPDRHLRPREELTNMNWTPPVEQPELARRVRAEKGINPTIDCSGCHR
ncbi:MAG: cytochrome c3 family protein [Candidatus Zixiibacteriota bacterium]